MSEQFKPLAEQVGERMASLLKDNRSIFTKPMKEDGTSQFVMPVNARSKQNYTGAAALVLLMQNRRDPRWLSFDQAAYNKTPVRKGAHGVLIEFPSSNEFRQKMENGQPVVKENGRPAMERVKLDEPVTVQAFLFNGKDLNNLKNGEVKPNPLTPVERAQKIIDNSNIRFEPAEQVMPYQRGSDIIHMPQKDTFEKPEQFYAEALREIAHATVDESRLNRPDGAHTDHDNLVKQELRANIAAILISAELNLPYVLGAHEIFLEPWAQILQENPRELFNAANDAQKIADFVVRLENPISQKQDTKQAQSGKLAEGMEIDYNNTTYKILQKQNKGAFKIEDLTTHEKIKIAPTSGLYKSLVNQLNNPQPTEKIGNKQQQEQVPEQVEAETESKSVGRKR